MNRFFGITITVIWLIAMAALVRRDVLPYWTAQDAPNQWSRAGGYQCGISNEVGKRIGTTWVTHTPGPQLVTVQSVIMIDLAGLGSYLPAAGRLLVDTNLTYEHNGGLMEFEFKLHGAGMPIEVSGERLGHDFACTARIGEVTTILPLDWRLSEGLSELLRPFTHLENLYVGQRWRLRLLDPFAMMTGGKVAFRTQLVTVTGQETIRIGGREVECYRIETDGATAWADDQGRVLVQEVRIPLLGRWRIEDEPFDKERMRTTIIRIRGGDTPFSSRANGPHATKKDEQAHD